VFVDQILQKPYQGYKPASNLVSSAKKCAECTHNWSPLKSPNATTLPSVSSPRDPAPSKAFPLNRFGGNGHIANVDGNHNQIESRARDDVRTRMVECVLGSG